MELGICVASKIDDVDHVVRAEALGFTHAWLADSQMLWSDVYATLALAAVRTSTIRLGTGVAVAGTRPAPVTAAAIATINVLAPGRTFLGIGTGNTAMRIMGHKPMPVAEFDQYLTTLAPLLRGEQADFRFRGRTAPVRHLMADRGFVNLRDPIPLYVSGFGPRSMRLAGRHGNGIVLSIPPVPEAMERVWRHVDEGAAEVGRGIDRRAFLTATLTAMVVLEAGEAADSDRVKRQCGAFALASLHYTYDQWRQYGRPPPPHLAAIWDDYRAMLDEVPEDVRHLRVHQGHNCWVLPEEERFLTRELIGATCMVGTADDLVDRLHALAGAGLDQVMLLPDLAARDEVIEQVAARVLPRLPPTT
jgi:alkanesulfonate monooxygenase SsuD/methylene tetrahydromethanopterin reductase-like flavin-dependent oxidoreductase (luciferase family)